MEDLGGGRRVVHRGERWRNKGYIGAGGEQTAQIITLSSGMEREREAGRPGEINGKRERERVKM